MDVIIGSWWRRRCWVLAMTGVTFVMCGWLAAGRAFAVGDANATSCPSATESSSGFRASLPDCRAYEIVSEANSLDTTNLIGSYGFPDGEHVYYQSYLPTRGEARSNVIESLLATRTSGGWMQTPISAPQGEGPAELNGEARTVAEGAFLTGDFSQAFVSSPFRNPAEEPPLDQAVGFGVYRLWLSSGAVETVSLPDAGVLTQGMIENSQCSYVPESNDAGCGMFLAGASSDGSRAFFVTTARLSTAPGSPEDVHEGGQELFERTAGHTYVAGVLPDGSVATCGAELATGVPSSFGRTDELPGAIAPSGANVAFTADNCGEPEAGLYLRDVVHDVTLRLPGSVFVARTGFGAGQEEKVITYGAGKLYEYHLGTTQTLEIGVSPSAGALTGGLLAYTPDGSEVYYLGPEEGIFRWHEGASALLVPGTVSGGYRSTGKGSTEQPGWWGHSGNTPVTTPDGSHLLFLDSTKLTEYENEGHLEVYVYDAGEDIVRCISCNPHGVAAEGHANLIAQKSEDVLEQRFQNPSPPFISDDGDHAVFETNEALVPQDVNGTNDVYEWIRADTHGCTTASPTYVPLDDGCLYLLSSGLGVEVPNNLGLTDGAHLVGASEDMRDVYFETVDVLLPGLDNTMHLYDARTDGGFPYTPASYGCGATGCELPTSEPAPLGASTTEVVSGARNLKNVKSAMIHRRKKMTESIRRRRLMRALTRCRKRKFKRRRVACEHVARRRYTTEVTDSYGRRVRRETNDGA